MEEPILIELNLSWWKRKGQINGLRNNLGKTRQPFRNGVQILLNRSRRH